ncbi:uncharacterized protein CC84DRAFT_934886 [Paraphaeosphaeria sporulosa]|uniref:DUF7730 domain-containing protein n=1 Tax=Paraphaeosphaeria sporulosa TaxID=1460663 RepID=A0A177C7M0_9PLEO|nr:uncharacterized protein CC84DRAFT_934886 [Paraphaeosphaeria sporulosa]OAG02842.1 hypothetical protein CC84DRAFT_934886 [Paraphaeosphaeria sporulosa]
MFAWFRSLLSPNPPITNRGRQRALKSRRRSLSVDRKGRKMKRQAQSPLFSMLPPEIRFMIYEMVLCETSQVHIIVKGSKRGSDTTEMYGRTCAEPRRYCPPGSRCRVQSQLLLTCRMVYCEAIDILYSRNAFIFQSEYDFVLFGRLTVPHHLRKIKKVCIGTFDYEGKPQFKSLPLELLD